MELESEEQRPRPRPRKEDFNAPEESRSILEERLSTLKKEEDLGLGSIVFATIPGFILFLLVTNYFFGNDWFSRLLAEFNLGFNKTISDF